MNEEQMKRALEILRELSRGPVYNHDAWFFDDDDNWRCCLCGSCNEHLNTCVLFLARQLVQELDDAD